MRLQAFTSVLALSLIGAAGVSAQVPYDDTVMSAEEMQEGLEGQTELLLRGGWTVVRPAEGATAEEMDEMVDTMVTVGSVGDAYGVTGITEPAPETPTTETVAAAPAASQPALPTIGEIVRYSDEARVDVAVQFDLNSANIRPEAVPQLQQICRFLDNNATLGLNLVGHTDTSGPAEYNLQLSNARANSVRTYLVTQCGVGEQRLYSVGFGETLPLASVPPTDARNRRVELQVASLL
jgi:outer membrane protein OmpA-like peptidoglycan-associated protein